MFCKNCGNKLGENSKFCSNCGAKNDSNVTESQEVKNNNKDKNSTVKRIFLIIGIIIAVLFGLSIIKSLAYDIFTNDKNDNNTLKDDYYKKEESNKDDGNKDDSNKPSTENTSKSVKGTYSRENFSGNTFIFETLYDQATFDFKNDSTFMVSYSSAGTSYKGTYEVYNGLHIAIKADEIKKDSSINNAEYLANDINNVANGMMDDATSVLNTYLVWLTLDDNTTIQPFVIKYDPDLKTGTARNILGQLSGTFKLK